MTQVADGHPVHVVEVLEGDPQATFLRYGECGPRTRQLQADFRLVVVAADVGAFCGLLTLDQER